MYAFLHVLVSFARTMGGGEVGGGGVRVRVVDREGGVASSVYA